MEKLNKPTMINISKHLTHLFTQAIRKALPLPDFQAQVTWTTAGSSDLTCPSAIKIYNMNQKKEGWTYPSSKEVAEDIIANIEGSELIEKIQVAQQLTATKPKKGAKDSDKKPQGPGAFFIDVHLKDSYLEEVGTNLLRKGILVDTEFTNRNVLVDFSSPNIAKEMHVGHLRSTIIGETTCRILEYLGNDVKRINHIGDWGTQFGMLIAYLEETYPNFLEEVPDIKDLDAFYVKAKKKFGTDEDFKKNAYERTVKLQTGDEHCRKAWQIICEISRREFNKIYERLNISLEEMGESFYDPFCREIVKDLTEKGIAIKDDGAIIIKVPGYKAPMMLVKSDGGLTYDTTDLAALDYRLNKMNRDWVIYVIGSEQELHLKLLYDAGKILGWHKPPHTRLDHLGFGLMLQKDGKKISSREGGMVKLTDLLDEAKYRAKDEILANISERKKRAEEAGTTYDDSYFTPELLEEISAKLGYSSVRYFDLRQYRMSQYKFDYDLMLDPKGNTAVYLFYNYARINSILKKVSISKEDFQKIIENERIKITHPKEREVLLHLLKFNDVIDEIFDDYAINKLCDYLYIATVNFSEFYDQCKVVGDENMNSRLLLIELTRRFMEICFHLLGMTPLEKI